MRPATMTLPARPKGRSRNRHKALKAITLIAPLALSLGSILAGPAQAQKAITPPSTIGPKQVGPSNPPQTGATASVLTHHNNNANTGDQPNEVALTPANVLFNPLSLNTANPSRFTKLFTRPLDGSVYAQPLYVPNVFFPTIPDVHVPGSTGSYHNVIYVATAHNSIYAWDADNNTNTNIRPLWYTTFTFPTLQITPVPTDDIGTVDISPEVGLIGTPVIDMQVDPKTNGRIGTMYFVTKIKAAGVYKQLLHALDIVTGQEVLGAPYTISATVPGSGDGARLLVDADNNPILDINGNLQFVLDFDPLHENQQPAMLLDNGTLYITWGGHGEISPLHGWVMAYQKTQDGTGLQQVGAFCLSPNGTEAPSLVNPEFTIPAGSGVWAGGAKPFIDSGGNIFFSTGFGNFNIDQGGTEYGQSMVKLNFFAPNPGPQFPPNPQAPVFDYFTTFDWLDQTNALTEVGSGGLMMLPDGVGPAGHPNLLIGAGGEGTIYLVDRGDGSENPTMGYFNAGDDGQIVQSLFQAVGPYYGLPAFYNNTIFFQGSGDVLKGFQLNNGYLPVTPNITTPLTDPFGKSGKVDFPGASPVISRNSAKGPGADNAIVWTQEKVIVPPQVFDDFVFGTLGFIPFPYGTPVAALHAYDPNTIITDPNTGAQTYKVLYNGLATGVRDIGGNAINYGTPTVANGKVYVGADRQLAVYGLLAAPARPKPVEADHFLVAGPVNWYVAACVYDGAFNSPFLPQVWLNQKQTVQFAVTAIGADQQPIKLNGVAHAYYRDLGTNILKFMGNVTFTNSETAIFSYAFNTITGSGYDIYVVDDDGHSSIQPNFDNAWVTQQGPAIMVWPTRNIGLDHISVQTGLQVRQNVNLPITIKALTANGGRAQAGGLTAAVYDTLPAGTSFEDGSVVPVQQFDHSPTGTSGWAYENAGMFDPVSGAIQPLPFTANFNGSQTFLNYKMRGVGKHVIVVTVGVLDPLTGCLFAGSNFGTSTAAVNVVP
ncbi:MAG TPA: hypothetical protein VKU00_33010 [Chthonomonadaceae bacterium]|nr:hypothetical protein [Chthonomonadaceae bacterium]